MRLEGGSVRGALRTPGRAVQLALAAAAVAVLTALLGLDDTLLLHDAVLPGRGVPEGLVLVLYTVAGLALAWSWLPERRSAPGAAFFAGAALLGLSVLMDAVSLHAHVAEESAKLLGILAWGVCGAWAFSEAVDGLRRQAGH